MFLWIGNLLNKMTIAIIGMQAINNPNNCPIMEHIRQILTAYFVYWITKWGVNSSNAST